MDRWRHEHVFLGADHERNERRTRVVIVLTLVMMVGEIVAGSVFGSMALLADGWHMGTHAGALSISALAYSFARKHANNARYAFGTGKVGDLAAFTSAVILAGVAVLIGIESFQRLVKPEKISFDQAIFVAVLGLVVNIVSAAILWQESPQVQHHHDGHDEKKAHGHGHHDHNLRSAYMHVVADAMTSVLAIVALFAGKLAGLAWMDPAMGIVGALVIVRWSYALLRSAGAVLLDVDPDPEISARIRTAIEAESDNEVADLHVWRLGPGHFAAIISVVTDMPQSPQHYKEMLAEIDGLAHVTVEVHPCPGECA